MVIQEIFMVCLHATSPLSPVIVQILILGYKSCFFYNTEEVYITDPALYFWIFLLHVHYTLYSIQIVHKLLQQWLCICIYGMV